MADQPALAATAPPILDHPWVPMRRSGLMVVSGVTALWCFGWALIGGWSFAGELVCACIGGANTGVFANAATRAVRRGRHDA